MDFGGIIRIVSHTYRKIMCLFMTFSAIKHYSYLKFLIHIQQTWNKRLFFKMCIFTLFMVNFSTLFLFFNEYLKDYEILTPPLTGYCIDQIKFPCLIRCGNNYFYELPSTLGCNVWQQLLRINGAKHFFGVVLCADHYH